MMISRAAEKARRLSSKYFDSPMGVAYSHPNTLVDTLAVLSLQQVMRRHLTGERSRTQPGSFGLTFAFSGLLLLVVVIAFLLSSMARPPLISSGSEKSNLTAQPKSW